MARLGLRAVLGVVRELRADADARPTVVVDGARALVPLLARALRAGGEPDAVVEHGPYEGAAALVWIGPPDEERLRRAARAGLPLLGLSEGERLPYVLDRDLVTLPPGQGVAVEALARALARRLGHDAAPLAARLPVLRSAVVRELIARTARRNAIVAAAVWLPGADLPPLTSNELRLVLRLAIANGRSLERAPELLAVVGAALGARRAARTLAARTPRGGFAVKGAVAYGVTRAIGEAARLRLATS